MEKTYDITQGSKGIQRVQASPIRAILDGRPCFGARATRSYP